MFELARKIVAGPKKKLQWNGKELDLTYVTDRIIAMAFPASGIEKAYRNSIRDVAAYLQEKHADNYLVINVSSRKYDYKYFKNKVLEYQWRDHLSPPLTTLFDIAKKMFEFLLKNKSGVVAVHCNHGKGRTGTTIISFILYTGFFTKYQEALHFYNKRRFVSLTYGVSQPCQKRYLQYFQKLRNAEEIQKRLICYKIKSIKQKGLEKNKYFLQICQCRSSQPKYRQLYFGQNFYPNVPLMGDISIQIFVDKWKGDQEVAMINLNTYFLNENQQGRIQEVVEEKLNNEEVKSSITTTRSKKFNGKYIKVNNKHSIDFEISIDFQLFCECHLKQFSDLDCPCQMQRIIQEKKWDQMIENIQKAKVITKLQACSLLFWTDYSKQIADIYLKQAQKQMKERQHQSRVKIELAHLNKQKSVNVKRENKSLKFQNASQNQYKCLSVKQSTKGKNLLVSSTSQGEQKGHSQDETSVGVQNNTTTKTNQTKHSQLIADFDYDIIIVNRNSV